MQAQAGSIGGLAAARQALAAQRREPPGLGARDNPATHHASHKTSAMNIAPDHNPARGVPTEDRPPGADPARAPNQGARGTVLAEASYRFEFEFRSFEAAISTLQARTDEAGHGFDGELTVQRFRSVSVSIEVSVSVRFVQTGTRLAREIGAHDPSQSGLLDRFAGVFEQMQERFTSLASDLLAGVNQRLGAGLDAVGRLLGQTGGMLESGVEAEGDALSFEVYKLRFMLLMLGVDEETAAAAEKNLRRTFAIRSCGDKPAVAEETAAAYRRVQLSFVLESSHRIEITVGGETMQLQAEAAGADPLVLDLDGGGVQATTPAQGVRFDITGDGVPDQVATVTGGNAYLALDRNGNGVIDSGRELFGDQHGAAHGFEELRKFDSNLDGRIDGRDPVFEQLLLWSDRNRDGVSQPEELTTLRQAGVEYIDLSPRRAAQYDGRGNVITHQGVFGRDHGSTGSVVNIILGRA